MAELFLDQFDIEIPDAVWRRINIAPWSGDLWLKLRPYTQSLRDIVELRAKRNPLSNRHEVTIDGEKTTVDQDNDRALKQEFLDIAIEDWRGVKGNPPATRENKIKIHGSQILTGYLVTLTNLMAGVEIVDDEKNS